MWEKRKCDYDSDREGSKPHTDFLVLPGQILSLAELKSTRDNEYARFYNLEVENQIQRGTTPIPGPLPGQDEGVERTRRRVVVKGDLIVHDADWFDFSGTVHAPVYLELQVDPWERTASNEWSWCEENQILGTVKATAYLEDDLLGVRVLLETSVEHAGTNWTGFVVSGGVVPPDPRDDCGKPKKCGKGYSVFTVGEGGEVAADTGDVACDENPVRPDEKKSFTRFVGGIRNEVWTP